MLLMSWTPTFLNLPTELIISSFLHPRHRTVRPPEDVPQDSLHENIHLQYTCVSGPLLRMAYPSSLRCSNLEDPAQLKSPGLGSAWEGLGHWSRVKGESVKRALPLSSTLPKTIAPSPGSHQICKQKTRRRQGEYHQYRATHLYSQKILTFSGLLTRLTRRTWSLNPQALMRTTGGSAAGTAPALAEDTASVKPAGKAERATTAKSEV